MADKDETKWLRRRITRLDEALPEAYIKTDYSKLTDKDFEKTLKQMNNWIKVPIEGKAVVYAGTLENTTGKISLLNYAHLDDVLE